MEEEVVGKIYDRRLTRRLLRYLWPYRRYVAISLVFLAINALLQIAGPLLMKMAIDRYLVAPRPQSRKRHSTPGFQSNPWTGLAQISLVYSGCRDRSPVPGVRSNVSDAVDRPERDVRSAAAS